MTLRGYIVFIRLIYQTVLNLVCKALAMVVLKKGKKRNVSVCIGHEFGYALQNSLQHLIQRDFFCNHSCAVLFPEPELRMQIAQKMVRSQLDFPFFGKPTRPFFDQ